MLHETSCIYLNFAMHLGTLIAINANGHNWIKAKGQIISWPGKIAQIMRRKIVMLKILMYLPRQLRWEILSYFNGNDAAKVDPSCNSRYYCQNLMPVAFNYYDPIARQSYLANDVRKIIGNMDDLYDILGLSGYEFDLSELRLLSPRFYLKAMMQQQPKIGQQIVDRELAQLMKKPKLTLEQLEQLIALAPYAHGKAESHIFRSGEPYNVIQLTVRSGDGQLLKATMLKYLNTNRDDLIFNCSQYHYDEEVKVLSMNYHPDLITQIASHVDDNVSKLLLSNSIRRGYRLNFLLIFDLIHQGRADILYFAPEKHAVDINDAIIFALMLMGEWTENAARFIGTYSTDDSSILQRGGQILDALMEFAVINEYEHNEFTQLPNDWKRWAKLSPIAAQVLALYAGQLGRIEIFQELMSMPTNIKQDSCCSWCHLTLTPDCWRYWFDHTQASHYFYLPTLYHWNVATVQQFIALTDRSAVGFSSNEVNVHKQKVNRSDVHVYGFDPVLRQM